MSSFCTDLLPNYSPIYHQPELKGIYQEIASNPTTSLVDPTEANRESIEARLVVLGVDTSWDAAITDGDVQTALTNVWNEVKADNESDTAYFAGHTKDLVAVDTFQRKVSIASSANGILRQVDGVPIDCSEILGQFTALTTGNVTLSSILDLVNDTPANINSGGASAINTLLTALQAYRTADLAKTTSLTNILSRYSLSSLLFNMGNDPCLRCFRSNIMSSTLKGLM